MEETENNSITEKPETDRPWLFKKGQSGNPGGRPKGKSLKQYTRAMLAAMTEEERQNFLNGLPKEIIWKMAEGSPEAKTDITTKGKSLNKPSKEDIALAELLNKQEQNDNSGTSEQSEGIDSYALGEEIQNKE